METVRLDHFQDKLVIKKVRYVALYTEKKIVFILFAIYLRNSSQQKSSQGRARGPILLGFCDPELGVWVFT